MLGVASGKVDKYPAVYTIFTHTHTHTLSLSLPGYGLCAVGASCVRVVAARVLAS